jgi:hypothetical protein
MTRTTLFLFGLFVGVSVTLAAGALAGLYLLHGFRIGF